MFMFTVEIKRKHDDASERRGGIMKMKIVVIDESKGASPKGRLIKSTASRCGIEVFHSIKEFMEAYHTSVDKG